MKKLHPDVYYFDTAMLPVHIGLVVTEAGWKAELKRLGCKDKVPFTAGGEAACHTFDHPDKPTNVLVCLDAAKYHDKDDLDVIGLLVHECVHVWQDIREAMRDPGNPGVEFEAYTIQWLTVVLGDIVLQRMAEARKLAKRKK